MSKSEYRLAFTWLSPGVMPEEEVWSVGVWHMAQPTKLKRFFPLAMDCAPPGLVVEGVGGARSRMNMANCTTSLGTAVYCEGFMFPVSSVVAFTLQFAGRPPARASSGLARSFWKSS